MKNFTIRATRKLIAVTVLFLLIGSFAKSQVITYPVPAQTVTRGFDSTLLTVRIDFPACTNVRVTVNIGAYNSPGVMQYISNSVTKTGGTASLNITEFDISNLNAPVFSVGNVNAGEFIVFTIKRQVLCGNGVSSKDNITVTGTGCSFSELDPNVNTYNILNPALTLVAPALLNNAELGTAYNRTFTVTNGGTGCLSTMGIWIKYNQPGSLQLNSLRIGATVLTPNFMSADSAFYVISGALLTSDGKFCNGETITFTENVTVLQCNASSTYGAFRSDFYGNPCENTTASSNVAMNNNTPNVTASIPVVDYNYCFRGDVVKQTVRLTNNGTGVANNIQLNVRNYIPGSAFTLIYFDTTQNWEIRNAAGTPIGVLKNFTNVVVSGRYRAGCTYETIMYEGQGNAVGNVFIPAGSYIDVDVYTTSYALNCVNLCWDVYSWLGLQSQVSYTNQCATANYTELYKTLFYRYYTYVQTNITVPTDIAAGVPFTMNAFVTELRTVGHPNGTGTTYFALPLGGTNISPNATSTTLSGVTYPMTMVSPNTGLLSDTLFIGPIAPNITYTNSSNMAIPLIATCGTAGAKTLKLFALTRYSNCSPLMTIGCRTATTNLHCAGSCTTGGATPLSFSLKRVNFGLPDNNEDHKPDASGSLNMALVADHNSVNGDTLRGTWNIKVYPNTLTTDPNYGANINYVYIDFQLGTGGLGQPGTVNALAGATIKIYPNSNPLATPITCSVNPQIIGTKAHYEFYGVTCRGGAWQANDSLVIEALYTVNQYNAYRYGGANNAYSDLFNTNIEVYSTTAQKTTPQTAPIAGQTYTCDHFNDYNQMSRIWISPWIYPGQEINGCTNQLYAFMRQYVRGQEGPNIFPYEYRSFVLYDSMQVTLPPGVVYRPGSASMYVYYSPSVAFPDAQISQVGNILYFKNIKSFFTPHGGSIIPYDETESLYITFRVDPTCGVADGNYASNTNTSCIGNGVNTPNNDSWKVNGGLSQSLGWVYTSPKPLITSSGTVVSSTGIGTWTVNLQNQSATISAPNSYFYLTPVNGLVNIVVKDGASVITPDANGFYRLGTLAASANRDITIKAEASDICVADSMRVNMGWGCTGYPTSFTLQSCTQSTWLKITNYASQIQLGINRQPKLPNIALCTNDTVSFKLNSALAAYADNPEFRVIPPAGFVIAKGQIEYPDGSGNWQDITPVIQSGEYIYRVEQHSLVQSMHGTQGLPGTIAFSGTSQRAANLRIVYSANCDFVSGSKLTVQQRADRPCGVPIPNDLGFNDIVRTDPINILGVNTSGTAGMLASLSNPTIGCGNTRFLGTATPIGFTTDIGDTILVTLPKGISFVSGSFLGQNGLSLTANSPIAGPGGLQYLKIVVPANIYAAQHTDYRFDVKADYVPSGCGNFNITTEFIRTTAPLSCGGACPNAAPVVMGSGSANLTINKPNLQITGLNYVSGRMIPGFSFWNEITLTNAGSLPANGPFWIEYYCSTSSTPFASYPFTKNVPVGASVIDTINVLIPNVPSCNGGDIIKAVIRPNSPAGEQCLCDSSRLQMLSNPLPVTIHSFEALANKQIVELDWKVGTELNVLAYYVEHSVDGVDFRSVGKVDATGASHYQWQHLQPATGWNYYRLKVLDKDGKYAYSDTRKIGFSKQGMVQLFPNPASTTVQLLLTDAMKRQPLTIRILTADGKLQWSKTVQQPAAMETIDVSSLTPGKYFVQLRSADGVVVKPLTIVK
jgi:hypothetical protein